MRTATLRIEWSLNIICGCNTGGCDVEKTYTGPKLPFADGKHSITHEFVTEMIQWFKDGKALPKRYVWEIILGAHEHFSNEESLVKVDLEDGVTCDVIGDVHGMHPGLFMPVCVPLLTAHMFARPILRHAPPVLADRRAKREALFADER